MKDIELHILSQTDSAYEGTVFALNEKFKSAWDDEVHNSFHLLLTQTDENHSRIHSGTIEAETIYHTAVGFNIEELCQTAENLCRKVDSL